MRNDREGRGHAVIWKLKEKGERGARELLLVVGCNKVFPIGRRLLKGLERKT